MEKKINKKKKNYSKGKTDRNDTKRTNTKVSDKRDEYYDSSNDPSWYIKNEQLMKDAASIPFSNMQGLPARVFGSLLDSTFSSNGTVDVGTIAAHYLFPIYGGPEKWSDPMNVAATNLYSFVRHVNSGAKVYDKANLMIYVAAMGSVYSFIEWCKRLYGMVGLASVYNRAIPSGLVRSNGVSFSDLSSNIAQFRTWLNRFILRCSIFGVPSKLPFFDRQQFLYKYLYSDATNVRAQIHEYVPMGFHVYQEPGIGAESDVGDLIFTGITPVWSNITETLPAAGTESNTVTTGASFWNQKLGLTDDTGKLTVQDIITFGENMLRPLAASEDFGIISGDILKAFGVEGMKQLTLIPEDYVCVPDYKPEVLHQIHNIRHMFPRKDLNTLYKLNSNLGHISEDLTTDIGALTMDVLTYRAKTPWCWRRTMSQVLDFDLDTVSPADVITASRLMATCRVGTATSSVYPVRIDVCGTEVCMFTIYYAGDGAIPYLSDNVFTDAPKVVAFNQHFKLAPLCFDWNGQTGVLNNYGLVGDVQNYTFVQAEVLNNITAIANLGLFDVPTIGGWNVKG